MTTRGNSITTHVCFCHQAAGQSAMIHRGWEGNRGWGRKHCTGSITAGYYVTCRLTLNGQIISPGT